MQKCGGVLLSFHSGHNSGKSLWSIKPQFPLLVLGQLLRGGTEAATLIAQACDLPSPSREILLFPAIPEELSRGPGQRWAGYTAAP